MREIRRRKTIRHKHCIWIVVGAIVFTLCSINFFLLTFHQGPANDQFTLSVGAFVLSGWLSKTGNETTTEGHRNTSNKNRTVARVDSGPASKSVIVEAKNLRKKTSDAPFVQDLRDAGIDSNALLAAQLPTWEQVASRFGMKPVLNGLETCEAYRRAVPYKMRSLAPAGTFNSGTNLMSTLLQSNCKIREIRGKLKGIDWQVNWGKHQSPRFRLENKVHSNIINEHQMPVVMVRDPYSWMQSMCKRRYSAHWFHVVPIPSKEAENNIAAEQFHCPNFLPNDVDFSWLRKSKNFVRRYYGGDPWMVDNVMDRANFTNETHIIPVRVRYHSATLYHDSLVHMWKDWYDEYFQATFPRLMIRLEDLVYHPRAVLQQVCECVGGTLTTNLSLVEKSAIAVGDNIHGANRTGLFEAMYRHVHGNRTLGMTHEDVAFARNVLEDSAVRLTMGYRFPEEESHEAEEEEGGRDEERRKL